MTLYTNTVVHGTINRKKFHLQVFVETLNDLSYSVMIIVYKVGKTDNGGGGGWHDINFVLL